MKVLSADFGKREQLSIIMTSGDMKEFTMKRTTRVIYHTSCIFYIKEVAEVLRKEGRMIIVVSFTKGS